MSRSIKKRVTDKLLGTDRLKQYYTPTQMKRLGSRLVAYDIEISEAKKYLDKDDPDLIIFSGIHSERDWSRTYWWEKGMHIVNVTRKYCIVSIAGIQPVTKAG